MKNHHYTGMIIPTERNVLQQRDHVDIRSYYIRLFQISVLGYTE
jgi:hypothetical protein